ncbi:alaserpin-like isoform X1 [Melitaea cinxia]|uniref:alaserpin-like isoform X1 n=1 Tax=Melitaea cinxia TaxID=113334 RepID=UPI001E271143|nr:alaserpin-like isoform X1 [Melitaea cinxia]
MKRLLCLCLLSLITLTSAQEKSLENYLHDGNNKFTAKLFYEIAKSNPNENVVLSAYSVMTPLAQLALASVGESHDELLDAIGMPNDNITKAAFSSVNSKLRSTKGVTLNTASKIYVADNYKINAQFAAATRDTFGSEIQNINFKLQKEAADEVNTWVENQTNNRIKDLVSPDSLNGDTRALLVNAIYFKGTWKIPFNKLATTDKDFHVTKEIVKQVPTMYSKDNYKYTDSKELNAQVLEIPYEGEESSCVFVLPHEIDGIQELEEKLKDPSILDKVTENMDEVEVEVYLPKFKIETTTDLKETLPKIDVKKLFSPQDARLDNLLENVGNLYIDSAIQKAFIEVNEEGAEATAANEFGIRTLSAIVVENVSPPKLFKADKPFYFVVKSGSLALFNGVFRSG